ncbi:NTE family protein [Alteromonadaceae bacterium Bs31]|nr:NTE family protein [Alteromonadaceae bacterium Bs31]
MSNLKNRSIGLALSGGGVKGLAHIALLKVLDELSIRPTLIVGTSMGAIIGSLYAAGLSGNDIESRVQDHLFPAGEKPKVWFAKRKKLMKWLKVFRFDTSRGGFVDAEGLFEHLFYELNHKQFSQLHTPFKALACDFDTGQELVLNDGDLLSAVKASMAVPGVFAPVQRGDKLLIDGGTVNNMPCDHIHSCDFRIASDVMSLSRRNNPNTTQVVAGALNIILHHNNQQQLKHYPPQLTFKPDTAGIDAFDFHKIGDVLKRGEAASETFRLQIQQLLEK